MPRIEPLKSEPAGPGRDDEHLAPVRGTRRRAPRARSGRPMPAGSRKEHDHLAVGNSGAHGGRRASPSAWHRTLCGRAPRRPGRGRGAPGAARRRGRRGRPPPDACWTRWLAASDWPAAPARLGRRRCRGRRESSCRGPARATSWRRTPASRASMSCPRRSLGLSADHDTPEKDAATAGTAEGGTPGPSPLLRQQSPEC